jgi:maleate isomerase
MTASYRDTRRFGLIIPSVNTVLERELYGLGLPDATFHFARVRSERGSDEAILRRMAEEAPIAARDLADVRPDAIMYACTSGSLVGGPGFDQQLASAISQAASVPASTTATAVVMALQALGARRIGVGTPYLEWVTQAEVAFFAAAGVETVASASLGLVDGHDMAQLSHDDVMELARSADHPEADAIFLSCTDLPTLSAIAWMEADRRKPVISSNLATLWALVGNVRRLRNLGRLMAIDRPRDRG